MTFMRCPSRLALALVLLIICADARHAQRVKCTLSAAQSPEMRGLRLGMTAEQVRGRFAILEAEPADEFGVERLRLDPRRNATEAGELRDIAIELIGNRVVSIRLVYGPSTSWKNQQAFAEGLSRSLKLPAAWKPLSVGSTVTGMLMECAGFKVNATLIGARIPVVYLFSLEAAPTLAERQAERERRLREFFKP
jgi:hypothetical protein